MYYAFFSQLFMTSTFVRRSAEPPTLPDIALNYFGILNAEFKPIDLTNDPKSCNMERSLGRCPSTVRPVFPVLVFQLRKQQNRTRTSSSSVLGTPPNRTRTKKFPLEELSGGLLC